VTNWDRTEVFLAGNKTDFNYITWSKQTVNVVSMCIVNMIFNSEVCLFQSNASLVHEMQLMKAQLQELQTMMRVSFDVQLDLQRTIRQEVAAAIAAVAQGK
jgi:hypothetical protein